MFSPFWSRRTNRKPRADRAPAREQPRLGMELLEDRSLLSNFTTGSLVPLSNPDPLANCPAGFLGANVSVEPYAAVNPTNPNNIVAIWIDHGTAGIVAGASFDGGETWQNVAIPGITDCTGGTDDRAWDPWLSFAPNGDLYSICIGSPTKAPEDFFVNKSTDGGRTWSNPIAVNASDYSGNGYGPLGDDKPSITVDPTNPNYVYATWARFNNSSRLKGNSAETMFARSTDGGQTWQPAQSIHTAPSTDFDWGNQIVVLSDGTLIDAFTEGQFTNTHPGVLTLLRSHDHGQTWSDPIAAVVQQPLLDQSVQPPNALVTDPDTGQEVEAHPMFASVAVDRNTGNLYAAWIDARFNNFQYNSIAFSMSSDGGLTWSTPIQVNQTPNTVPPVDRQAWNPAVAVAANGTVAVSYYDFRNNTSAPGALTDYWLAYAPAGTTNSSAWGEVRLTDTSFNLEQAPTRFNGALWVGDYEGLAAAGNDFVAVWGMPDGMSAGQESIFFRRAISGSPLEAVSIGHNQGIAALSMQQVDALLPEALHRWQAAGIDTPALHGIDIHIANLGDMTLGLAAGNTIWLDDNAAGWGWFADSTPSDDSEFLTPGNQGEQNRMDLLTVLEHEVGHLLGYEHQSTGVMIDTLPAGTRRTPEGTLTSSPIGFWFSGVGKKKDGLFAAWLADAEN